MESFASVAVDDDSCSLVITEDGSIVDYNDVDVSLTMVMSMSINTVPNCLQHELFLNSTLLSTVATNKRPVSTSKLPILKKAHQLPPPPPPLPLLLPNNNDLDNVDNDDDSPVSPFDVD